MPGRGGAQGSSSVVETACVEARPEGFCVLHPLCGLRYLEDPVHRRDWIYLALILALLLLVLWIDLFSPVIAFWRPVPEESDPQQAQELKVAILLFGGATIKQFIVVMFVGLASGTYSSIFNAVPLLVVWEKGELAGIFRRGTAWLVR